MKSLIRRIFYKVFNPFGKFALKHIWNTRLKFDVLCQTGKNRNSILGGISACTLEYPGGVYVGGWYLPHCNYNKVEIYYHDEHLGDAVLHLPRGDVYRDYPVFNERRAGWKFWAPGEYEAEEQITIIVKQGTRIVAKHTVAITDQSVQKSLEEICNSEKLKKKPIILYPGLSNRMALMAKLASQMPEYQFAFLLAGLENDLESACQNVLNSGHATIEELDSIETFMLPEVFRRNWFIHRTEMPISEEIEQTLEKYPELEIAAENIFEKYSVQGMTKSYAQYYAYHLFHYARVIADTIAPSMAILWNRFIPLQSVFEVICKLREIPIVYIEGGSIPGTLVFEQMGQMGESYPAQCHKEFLELPISDEDRICAKRIWDYVYESRMNDRYNQSGKHHQQAIIDQLDPEKPTIFFAGQDDFESGMVPYSAHSETFHSPVFRSSHEAMLHLAQLAEKNEWNFIYKQHPLMRPFEASKYYPSHVIRAENVEICDLIDIVDVTIVLMSQTAYMSLIRGKPVVMMGYSQIRGKGCAYEAYALEDIQPAICQAMQERFTSQQKDNFILHIAQMCKYYLYDNILMKKAFPYGCTMEECIVFLRSQAKEGRYEEDLK